MKASTTKFFAKGKSLIVGTQLEIRFCDIMDWSRQASKKVTPMTSKSYLSADDDWPKLNCSKLEYNFNDQ